MIVDIHDDFSLKKIAKSGQCFRVTEQGGGWWRFIATDKAMFMRKLDDAESPDGAEFGAPFGAGEYETTADADTWAQFWKPYFDMDRNYAAIRAECFGKSGFVDEAMRFGAGLRVLNQDAWEMLVTFIISQRKSIPAISSAVAALSEMFGEPIHIDCPEGCKRVGLYSFPTPESLASASDEQLKKCSLGYRVGYVRDAARMVVSGELDLDELAGMQDDDLFCELQRVHGVGKKVANCVCLFGYGRSQMVPVDVWIQRAIDEDCNGCDPFAQYGADAGIMQQYVFYYMTQRK